MLFRVLFCLLFLICCVKGQCQPRDLREAAAVFRRCRKPCDPMSNNCAPGVPCLCDHECGYSCVNMNKVCRPPPSIANMARVSVFRLINGSRVRIHASEYHYNDLAEYECSPGYRKMIPILPHYCHSRRRWTGRTNCIRSCRPYNPVIALRQGLTCGRPCQSEDNCPPNHKCLCDGHCGLSCIDQITDCGEAPSSPNTVIEYIGEGGFGQVAHYTCEHGYFSWLGDSFRRCSAGGSWSGDLLVCQRITCGNPQLSIQEAGGRILSQSRNVYNVGTRIQVGCPSGMELFGSENRTCLSSGQWSGRHPACDFLNNNLRCPHPGVPVNGRIISGRNFTVGSFVEFACNRGYDMVGDNRQECLYFLQWSGSGAPKCINPHYPIDLEEGFNRLRRVDETIQRVIPNISVGNSITTQISSSTDVILIIDMADTTSDERLQQSIAFAENRAVVMARDGLIRCSVIVFASSVNVLLRLKTYVTSNVVENLRNIVLNRANIAVDIGRRRNTESALLHLNETLAQSISAKQKPVAFLLINGEHEEGSDPRTISNELNVRYEENKLQIFVVTYGGGSGFADALNELRGLATSQSRCLIRPNLKELEFYLARKKTDVGSCGKTGDAGGFKRLVKVGNVFNGRIAEEGAWPWHGIICRRFPRVLQTFQRLRGGASLLNKNWALTAAHVFDGLEPHEGWERNFIIFFGITELPTSQFETLPDHLQIFDLEEIFIQPNYSSSTYDYDIALVRIGRPIKQLGFEWQQIGDVASVNYSFYVRPICLPCISSCARNYLAAKGLINERMTQEERCLVEINWLLQNNTESSRNGLFVVTGFGADVSHGIFDHVQPSQTLKQGIIRLLSDQQCTEGRQAMLQNQLPPQVEYTPRMVCGSSNEADACRGDSGGAIVREIDYGRAEKNCWVQVAIVSWGLGCGRGFPGFYVNLPYFIDWIINKTYHQNNVTGSCHRDDVLVEAGRSCKKSCSDNSDCRGRNKQCICDDVCGLSCIGQNSTCVELPPIQNGRIEGGRAYGDTATYHCNDGFDLRGSPTRKCRSDRLWSGLAPTCFQNPFLATTCPPPPRLRNGFASANGSLPINTQVTYRCYDGYVIRGQPTNRHEVTCQSNGEWSAHPPVCDAITCAPPPPLQNGFVSPNGRLPFNNRVTYRCNEGYIMRDQPSNRQEAICQLNGEWSAPPPVCAAEQRTYCRMPNRLKSITRRVSAGGMVTYTCKPGFAFILQSVNHVNVTCLASGLWSDDVPVCRGFGCTLQKNICEFPFIYRGVYHNSCTTRDFSTGNPWCSRTPSVTLASFGECKRCNIVPNFHIHDSTNSILDGQCGTTFIATRETASYYLPDYPSPYRNNYMCSWTITAATPNAQVEIILTKFKSEKCCDIFEISDGSTINAGNRLNFRGWLTNPYSFVSTFGVLSVRFRSDDSINYSGFQFRYREHVYDEYCGEQLTANHRRKTVTSPGWPRNYPNGIYCKWTITALAGAQVQIQFNVVDTEACCDHVVVRDGTHENSSSLAYFKGYQNDSLVLTSTQGIVTITFRSDTRNSGRGFQATYQAVRLPINNDLRPNPECNGGLRVAPNVGYGNISLPPVQVKGKTDYHCVWTVLAIGGRQIRFWVSYMHFTTAVLVIRDGSNPTSPKIGAVYGPSEVVYSFVSTSGALRVELIDFDISVSQTFFAYYEIDSPDGNETASSCGGTFVATSSLQYLKTPNWPEIYPGGLNCTWIINALPNRYVKAHFLSVLTKKNEDILQVYHGTEYLLSGSGSINQRFTVFSRGFSLIINFVSMNGNKYSGFKVAFEDTAELPTRNVIVHP